MGKFTNQCKTCIFFKSLPTRSKQQTIRADTILEQFRARYRSANKIDDIGNEIKFCYLGYKLKNKPTSRKCRSWQAAIGQPMTDSLSLRLSMQMKRFTIFIIILTLISLEPLLYSCAKWSYSFFMGIGNNSEVQHQKKVLSKGELQRPEKAQR